MDRKSALIFSVVFILFSVSACTPAGPGVEWDQSSIQAATVNAAFSEQSGAADQPGTNDNSTGVIAKSGNDVSGQDNAQVMKELDKELDALFSSIEKLEDVKDGDLTGEGDGEK